ncbi:hypothetical protein AWH62_02075 [Maricaulis sp. W15]|nr:hypothetical protein AWH62_02075 [Maricaulis sp. W15]
MKHLATLVASVGIAAQYYADGRVTVNPGDYLAVVSNRFPMQLRVPMSGPVEAALMEIPISRIDLAIEASTPAPTYKIWTSGYQSLVRHLIAPLFVDFYEQHLPWIEANLGGRDGSKWPAVLDFARVIRNACSHGGKLTFKNSTSRSVNWRGITYSPADHDKLVVCADLSLADIIALVFDISDELDARGCPQT